MAALAVNIIRHKMRSMQADNMTSREAVKEQFKSFQDYEEDFM